ncbi:hypothetical protein IM538_09105 [Cytobacillus suaedae]|nr:hypothetical protein IM538_09105 [Cytobacillus suaedae]
MKTLQKEKQGPLLYADSMPSIEVMTKVEVMDKYLVFGKKIGSIEIRRVVNDIFTIDLNRVSEEGEGKATQSYPDEIMQGVRKVLSMEGTSVEKDTYIMSLPKVKVMDLYLQYYGDKIESSEIRRVINQIYGINLNGISGLEAARISLYSKGQWISKTERDLFEVHTGTGDIDVWILPSEYFVKNTGITTLPEELQDLLKNLGYWYDNEKGTFYYSTNSNETVPDSFKGQTMGTISTIVKQFTATHPEL